MSIYNETIPYLYIWIHIATGKWYIGSKIREGWNPSRHEEYICSSKVVKPLIIENKEEWCYDIMMTGPSNFIKELENIILAGLDAKNDPMSFNQHNGDGLYNRFGVKESVETRLKKREARLGEKNPMFNKRGILSPNYGKIHSEETKQKQSDGLKKYSVARPASHNASISKALTGNKKLSERMLGKNNPMYGTSCSDYNKQMTKLKNSGDRNPMKKSIHQRQCIHCDKIVAKNHYTMFHGDKCKLRPI